MSADNSGKTARRKKTMPVGKPFPKGVSGNPGGRPPLTDEERQARRLSREQFAEVANLLLSRNREELQKILDDPKTPYFMELMIKLMFEMKYDELDKMLNRLIGKVPDEVNVGVRKPYVVERPNGQTVEMGVRDLEEEP
jgi:hypothetical protein